MKKQQKTTTRQYPWIQIELDSTQALNGRNLFLSHQWLEWQDDNDDGSRATSAVLLKKTFYTNFVRSVKNIHLVKGFQQRCVYVCVCPVNPWNTMNLFLGHYHKFQQHLFHTPPLFVYPCRFCKKKRSSPSSLPRLTNSTQGASCHDPEQMPPPSFRLFTSPSSTHHPERERGTEKRKFSSLHTSSGHMQSHTPSPAPKCVWSEAIILLSVTWLCTRLYSSLPTHLHQLPSMSGQKQSYCCL